MKRTHVVIALCVSSSLYIMGMKPDHNSVLGTPVDEQATKIEPQEMETPILCLAPRICLGLFQGYARSAQRRAREFTANLFEAPPPPARNEENAGHEKDLGKDEGDWEEMSTPDVAKENEELRKLKTQLEETLTALNKMLLSEK